MGWYCYYLPNFNVNLFNWSIIILLGFEIAYFGYLFFSNSFPELSFYVLKNTKLTIVIALLYGLLALSTLIQALKGKPILGGMVNTEAV